MGYKALKNRIRSTWQGKASSSKMKFAFRIADLLKDLGMSNADLAKKLDTSNAYITKILRGDQNLSIDSMHKIADALGTELHINMTRPSFSGRWFEVSKSHYSATKVSAGTSSKMLEEPLEELECA